MKVLLIGNSPLPEEIVDVRPAAGLRTWQFLSVVKEFDYRFMAIAMPECYGDELPASEGKKVVISKDDASLVRRVQEICDEFKPDVIVGVNTFPSYVASKLRSEAVFWADLNGWIMAEGQAQADKAGNNDYLGHYLEMEKSVVMRADKFSTVSEAQKFALMGELACLGRIGRESFGYEFAISVPNATEWFKGEKAGGEYKFEGVPKDAFKVLWLGGYNNWVDEKTLFKGLEIAMKKCPDLYFVSTGGSLKGLDNKTFNNFKRMIEESDLAERFVFLGWVKTEEIPAIYNSVDVGLNVDRYCLETMTGARNRINEMMKFGLPVISSLGTEISHAACEAGAALGFEHGDSEGFAGALVKLYEDRGVLQEMSDSGKEYVEKWGYAAVMKDFEQWLKAPVAAPDRGSRVSGGKVRAGLRYLRERGVKQFFKKVWQRLRG